MSECDRRMSLLDVVIVVDATMDEAQLELVQDLVASDCIREPARLALVLYGDHPDCVANPRDQTPSFDVLPREFSEDLGAQRGWLRSNLVRVPLRYSDAALECALAAVNALTWRDEAAKHALIVGWSLPHHSRIAELRLRTGVPCPRDQCWLTQLERLEQRSHVRAATPPDAPLFARSFLGLLRRSVWDRLAGRGRPESLDGGLAGRWSTSLWDHHERS